MLVLNNSCIPRRWFRCILEQHFQIFYVEFLYVHDKLVCNYLCWIFIWFGYQGNTDFIKRCWKYFHFNLRNIFNGIWVTLHGVYAHATRHKLLNKMSGTRYNVCPLEMQAKDTPGFLIFFRPLTLLLLSTKTW